MASAQIQLFYNTATSSTTTTKPTAYTTRRNISCCQKEATTLSTTLSCQYTETSKSTTTAAKPTIQGSPGIAVINRKQSSPKTDISKSSSNENENLDTSNKLEAEEIQTAATTTTTTTTLPSNIISCHQATDSNQHSRINTKNDSSTESVPATTTTTLQLQTQLQQKSFLSASTSIPYTTQWPGERNAPRKYEEEVEKPTKQQDRVSVDISTSVIIDDQKGGEDQSEAAARRQQICVLPIINATFSCERSAASKLDGEMVEMLEGGGDGATISERAAVATAVVGGEEDEETVSVNINIASSYRSDCCANEDIRNRIFTGIYKRIVVVVIEEEQERKQEEATSCELIKRDNNERTPPTTKCCRKVYASDALHQLDSCNNVAEANKCCLQKCRKINANKKCFQSRKQKRRSPKSRLSSINKKTAAKVSSKSHSRQSTNNVYIHSAQHISAALRGIQHSTRQRNLHSIKKNNNDDQQQPKKLNTSNTNNTASKFVAMGRAGALGRLCAGSSISGFLGFQKFTTSIFPLLILLNLLPLFYAECDQTFVSRIGGPQNGTFSAPLLHNPKNHSRQCLYTFLAGPGQRVEVVFTSFNLRGSPPDGSAVGELPTCVHEYMDIYSEVQSSDPAELINSPFGGRYCGTIPPRRRISMYRAIAISFFSSKNISMPDLFEGRYRFINASEYEIGIPIAGSPCSYTITPSMSVNKTGALISPTYPGAYPKDMSCTYQFLGESNQRVRLEFRDFDLFFGGPHCPFDYVKVYDGPDNSSALIGTYCGQQRNLVLYSSESSLFVHFYTLPRTANTQNRGFKGIYEFSESFVKLDFIRENDGIHIRGSECDQKILSRKESTGVVLSPNYPYPYIPKTVCRYFIYGMQDAQHLERVRLEFSAFNIPKVEHKDRSESNCTDGYLKIYLKGQETADAYDKFDYELCGNETQRVVSDGPRLAMVFSSGELQGRGFKGKYTFETEYKIPGTAAPDGTCSFTYVSGSKKRGDLNSPRYPSNYPSATNCSYLFLAEPNEQVTIVFDHFKVKADGNTNATAGAYGSGACFEDWLEMYLVYRDNNDRFLGRYCGLTSPGPVESPRGAVGLRITLHTDQENVASGFKARYFFEAVKSEVGDCGGNFSNEDSGIITSPNYPAQYKAPGKGMASMACNWIMTARPGYKLSINFEHFSIEGDPANRGCPAAVLRLWVNVDSDQPPLELCGEKPPIEQWHYISTGQTARISFTTSDKTVGAQGFRIVWTEIQDSGPGPPSIGLLCESTYHFQCEVGYCISDKLRCDGVKNCGPGDDSDELHCITEAPEEDHGVLIIITLVVVSFLICLLCTLYHSRRKRRHHPRQLGGGLHRNAAHYDSTTSATGLSSSRRHLQAGGSISGSLHGINSGTLIIPPAPLPPTSLPPPPHICIAGVGAGSGIGSGMLLNAIGDDVVILDDDDNEEDDNGNNSEDQHHQHHHLHHRHHHDIYINDVRFDEASLEQLNRLGNV